MNRPHLPGRGHHAHGTAQAGDSARWAEYTLLADRGPEEIATEMARATEHGDPAPGDGGPRGTGERFR
ncbi:hypothetical protein MO973_01025 [Paenibacillus sp. TRM 82003]|uniref:hypothetical protein n=1 Tax=Kineococcus sp. TRM81007 TaxID=2925831 RepID=UPI001F5AD4AC|nr:hypothetical protein [Kineococcus sp. TRM81007]MCI2239444.1 hypothetical protein [Kineococcus sp. TRM81007]MCI3918814.1 hypothetical protein [Paenibacillus sp. TRM 82003]